MTIKILGGIIFLLLGIIIYLSTRLHATEDSISKEQQEMLSQLHQREVDGLKEIETKLKIEQENAHKQQLEIQQQLLIEQQNLENYKTNQRERTEQDLALYREQELNRIKQEVLNLDIQNKYELDTKLTYYKTKFDENKNILEEQINTLQNDLFELKQKRDNTLAIIKEEEKLKNESDFYRIILKKEDVEDIEQLRSIEKRLNNKDVLRKLIYKTFIEVPMNALFGRVGIKELPGVYKITNLKNNMVYIGQSTNVKNRVKAHIQASLGISTIASQIVHDAMAEEGLENFSFQIIEECSKEQLNDREKYYINYYDSNHYGYNRTAGGAK